jgi:hypothetical protein
MTVRTAALAWLAAVLAVVPPAQPAVLVVPFELERPRVGWRQVAWA